MKGRSPDYAAPLVGWRMWRFGAESPDLRSLDGHSAWHPAAARVALCRSYIESGERTHLAPAASCGCGVYAYRREELVRAYLPAYGKQALWNRDPEVDVVWGEVYLWGRVVVHAEGFRAQFAYPKRIFVPPQFRRLVEWHGATMRRMDAEEAAALLAHRYRVPVEAS